MSDHSRNRQGLFAAIFDELARAVVDVRRQVVDRGWFGHADPPRAGDFYGQTEGTGRASMRAERELAPQQSFEEAWAVKEPTAEKVNLEKGLDLER